MGSPVKLGIIYLDWRKRSMARLMELEGLRVRPITMRLLGIME
jgi:Mrp family chromosome partitioning ATPase